MAEREAVSATCDLNSKIGVSFHNVLIFGTIWHFTTKIPASTFWGRQGEVLLFLGKNWGSI